MVSVLFGQLLTKMFLLMVPCLLNALSFAVVWQRNNFASVVSCRPKTDAESHNDSSIFYIVSLRGN